MKRSTVRGIFRVLLVGVICIGSVIIAHAVSVTISAQVGSSGGGGGGGGGGGSASTGSTVNFSGRAYPLSRVTILRDNHLAVTTISGPDAKFTASLTDVSVGNHTFVVYTQDTNGRTSETFSFPVIITAGVTTDISGIFLSPTIAVDKAEVKQGDNVVIFGQSAPSSDVVISVHSAVEIFKTVKSDASGAYLLTLDTSPLEIGSHTTKSKAVLLAEASPYGKPVNFKVGLQSVTAPQCGTAPMTVGDVNCDGRVNLVDFSILAYWYQKPKPLALVDLNHDGVVNLVDFSILAYHWTG